MTESLKQRTGFAIFWSFIDKGGQQILQLAFGIVLARILLTSDFGTFALLAIFTAIANILQESGFSSALIRKKEPSKADLASVFYFNIGISFLVYLILFLSAPAIGWFYEKPILAPLARITFLSFIFNAFAIIQNVVLIRRMDFKTNTKITLISSIIAGSIAVLLAWQGYGVWALATQLTLQTFLRSLLLWLFVKWIPQSGFSFDRIKEMFPYSSRLLATSVMNQFCSNLYANIIGKYFSTHQAGVYSQANKFSIIPQSVISDGVRTAAFPALSKIKEDSEYMKKAYRKVVRITAFISFPVAFLVVVIAKPLILILITEKWADAISLLQILAIGGAFFPLLSLTTTLLQTIGRSGLILKLEMFRNILALATLIFTAQMGVTEIVIGISNVSFIAFIVSTLIAGKNIAYKISEAIRDIVPYILIAFVSYVPFAVMPILGIDNLWVLLITPCIFGSLIYLAILKLAGSVILSESISFLRGFINKQK